MKVLFVCTGNTCRSPFAEALATRLAPGTTEHEFWSAGTHAHEGAPCPPEAVAAALEHGIDLSPHRARQLTAELEADADLVVRLHHVPDPFGRGTAAYLEAYTQIAREVAALL